MYGVERDLDQDMFRVLHMVQELSEQLAHNQKLVSTLQNQTGTLKGQALQNGTGYSLRRFNVDLSQEVFESELERANAQTIIENQTLVHENKQLSMLLKEYEQTMDTVMTKFRNHALAAQQHELTLRRHYETLWLSRAAVSVNGDIASNSHISESLHRLTENLRKLLRSLGGEDPEASNDTDEKPLTELVNYLDDESREDWSVEREAEIARLEKENEELRKMLGIDSLNAQRMGWDDEIQEHKPILHQLKQNMAQANISDSWAQRNSPQLQPYGAGPVPGNAMSQQQNIPLQRTIEFQPGMRVAGQMRRPSMPRGRGFWPMPSSERTLMQMSGVLDLAG